MLYAISKEFGNATFSGHGDSDSQILEACRDYGAMFANVKYGEGAMISSAQLAGFTMEPPEDEDDGSSDRPIIGFIVHAKATDAVGIVHSLRAELHQACINCGRILYQARKRHCSIKCSQICEEIRSARRHLKAATFDESDIVNKRTTRLAFAILGDGYDKPQRRRKSISKETLQALFDRAAGKCENCGSRFAISPNHNNQMHKGGAADAQGTDTTVQHMHGSSSELSNLQLWCRGCNNAAAPKPVPFKIEEIVAAGLNPEDFEMMTLEDTDMYNSIQSR
jgi:hypothetical protein